MRPNEDAISSTAGHQWSGYLYQIFIASLGRNQKIIVKANYINYYHLHAREYRKKRYWLTQQKLIRPSTLGRGTDLSIFEIPLLGSEHGGTLLFMHV